MNEMSKLEPCPFCGGEVEIVPTNGGNPFTIWCEQCGLEFGIEKEYYHYQVVAAWNRRAVPPNEALTLEQLRGMDFSDPPIWDSCLNVWCAVRAGLSAAGKDVYYFGGGSRPIEANRFYLRKPEPEGVEV